MVSRQPYLGINTFGILNLELGFTLCSPFPKLRHFFSKTAAVCL